jgi:predicted transposase
MNASWAKINFFLQKNFFLLFMDAMLTYSAAIKPVHEGDDSLLVDLLERYREAVNAASKLQFEDKLMGLTELHNAFYYEAREKFPDVPSQVVIKAEQESIACYRSMKSNKKAPKKPFEKRNLSLRLDKRISSRTKAPTRINIHTRDPGASASAASVRPRNSNGAATTSANPVKTTTANPGPA